MNISFGKKIPVGSCTLVKNITGEDVQAKLFEYDCNDESDKQIFEENSKELYIYRKPFLNHIQRKIENKRDGDNSRFYTVELPDGEIAGAMKIRYKNSKCLLDIIETNNCEYKYAGKSLIALGGAKTIVEGKNIFEVYNPVYSAIDVYEHLGFKSTPENVDLHMDKKEIEKLNKDTAIEIYA